MTPKRAYIKIEDPAEQGALFSAGRKKLNAASSTKLIRALSPEDWADFTKALTTLAGDNIPEEARKKEEWFIGVLLGEDESSKDLLAFQYVLALEDIVLNASQDFADTYQKGKDCFYLEYDPADWFIHPHPYSDGHKSYTHFTSGHLFALAKLGILQAHQFEVDGNGLDTLIGPWGVSTKPSSNQ